MPEQREYDAAHPTAIGGYPELPTPPPYPANWTKAQVEQHARTIALSVRTVFENLYLKDLIAAVTTSWAKQAWRPVHLPPWVNPTYRSVPIGQTSTFAGTTVPSAASWTTIVSDFVPNGYVGNIRWVGHGVSGATDWANINWRIVHGPSIATAVPYRQPFLTWQHQIGQIEAPTQVEGLIVHENEYVALQAQQATGGSITGVMAMIRGWMWQRTGGSITDGAGGHISV